MFTGIVEELGTLREIDATSMLIEAHTILPEVMVKDSIAVDGICLTVIERDSTWFRVETMPETLRCTRLGELHIGDHLNLERSLAAQGRIGGHMVQGHIEATAQVLSLKEDGIGQYIEIELPASLRRYIITKGFVALNGVSLTVVESKGESFSIALIPYTRSHTNLGELQVGSLLNIESDIIGRYVASLLSNQANAC